MGHEPFRREVSKELLIRRDVSKQKCNAENASCSNFVKLQRAYDMYVSLGFEDTGIKTVINSVKNGVYGLKKEAYNKMIREIKQNVKGKI